MKNEAQKILLVDDDPIDRMAFERFVRTHGFPYQYEIAGSLQEAKERLAQQPFAAVILDYMLGDGTAFDLFQHTGQAAVIIVTGLGDENIAVSAMKAGAVDYLVKDSLDQYLTTLPLTIERAIHIKANEGELARYREDLERLVAERTTELEAEIGQHQQTEMALLASKQEWERTFDAITDSIVILNAEKKIVQANRAAERMLPRLTSQPVGLTCQELLQCDCDRFAICPVDACFANRTSSTHEITHKNGSTYLISLSPIFDENRTMNELVLVGKDVTDQKHLELQLLQAQKMEAIGALAGGIAHDFNNILTAILGHAQIGLHKAEPDSTIHNAFTAINAAGLRARDVIRQILSFSGKHPETKKRIQPQPILNEALELLRATLPSTISIHLDIDPECGAIMANPVQMHQILMNLCTNASHAMEKSGGQLTVCLKETTLRESDRATTHLAPGPYMSLSIRDTGTGITSDNLTRIFDPFFTTKAPGTGTGMGLSIVQSIVKECGGTILVKSREGEGTLFQIYLPICQKEETPSPKNSEPCSPPLQPGTARILFADDEEQLRFLAKTLLEELGYKVTLAEDGIDAWRIFTADPSAFDLVITDKTMPEINGLVLAGKIRSVRTDLPIILCSGDQTGIIPPMLGSVGIKKFLTKPFVIEELAEAAQEALRPEESPESAKKKERETEGGGKSRL